jgi:hypothetical protein
VILGLALAHAECPCEGFRVTTLASGRDVRARLALVEDFDGAFSQELTLHGQTWWRQVGVGAELAATSGFAEGWTGAGVGNLVVDGRWLFARRRHGLGLRLRWPVGSYVTPNAPVSWWGTVPETTLPMAGLALAYEGSKGHFTWHAHLGAQAGRFWAFSITAENIDAGVGLATAWPIAGDWWFVGEGELTASASPGHLRALARYAGARAWTLDAGLAAPLPGIWLDPTLQVIAQARHSF